MKIYSHYLSAMLCLVVAVSCTKELSDENSDGGWSETVAVESSGHRVPVDAALAGLRSLIKQIDGTTRSGVTRTIREVLPLRSRMAVLTRAVDAGITDRPDTLLYLVNFDDDAGYAILGADDRLVPIFALVDAGSISEEDFTGDDLHPANEYILNGVIARIVNPGGDSLSIGYPPIEYDRPQFIMLDTSEWFVYSYLAPILLTKWDQKWPFNKNYPKIHPSVAADTTRYSAGCWMVALGQILAGLEYRVPQPSWPEPINSIDWNGVKQISNYMNYDHETTCYSTAENQQQVADLMYRLYTGCRAIPAQMMPNYNSFSTLVSSTAVGASIDSVAKFMRDTLRLRNVRVGEFNGKDAVYMVANRCPVGTSGKETKFFNARHAWVIDGFMDIICTDRDERDTLFHCNWGYKGKGDGFYSFRYMGKNNYYYSDPHVRDAEKSMPYDFTNNQRFIYYER